NFTHRKCIGGKFLWFWNVFGTFLLSFDNFPRLSNYLGVNYFKRHVSRCYILQIKDVGARVKKAKSRRIVFTRCSLALRARSRAVRFANRARSFRQKYIRKDIPLVGTDSSSSCRRLRLASGFGSASKDTISESIAS